MLLRKTYTLVWLLATAIFVREIYTGGMTKQCVYEGIGNTYVITIPSVSICPLSIEV